MKQSLVTRVTPQMEPRLLLETNQKTPSSGNSQSITCDHLNTTNLQHSGHLNVANIQIGIHLSAIDIQSLVTRATP